MAFSISNRAWPPFPPIMGEQHLNVGNRPLIQATRMKEQKLWAPLTSNVLRRDTLLYLTAETLGGLTILATEPAKARVGGFEMKKKIMETLKKLREEAGSSKPKTENGEQKPSPQPPSNESKLPLLAPPIPFPNAQEGIVGPFVEANVP